MMGGTAVVGPLSKTWPNSSAVKRRKGGQGEGDHLSQRSLHVQRWEAQEKGECGEKKEVQYRSSTECDRVRQAGAICECHFKVLGPAGRGQWESSLGTLSLSLHVQWCHVGRSYSPEIDKDTDNFSCQAWAATVMMALFTQVRNTRLGPLELPFEYVKVEVLGDKVAVSGRRLDMCIKLFLSDHTVF